MSFAGFGRTLAACLVAMAGLGVSDAAAQCAGGGAALQVTGTVSPTLATYNPFALSPQSQTFSFTVLNTDVAECRVSAAFLRLGTPVMSKGSDLLGYDILNGSSSIVFSGGFPSAGHRVDLTIAGNNGTAVVNYTVEVPDRQAVSAGTYLDPGLSLEFFSRDAGGTLTGSIKSVPASVSDTVASLCNMPTPSITNLNFSSRIVNALPTAQPQVLEVPDVQCTTPAFVKLTGDAMRQTPSPGPLANFDNFINYTALATLGSASVSLTTSAAVGPDTATSASATSDIAAGMVDLSVELVPGNHLQAGEYSGVLTLEIIPAF